MVRRVELFNLLQGVISVYKPPGVRFDKFRRSITLKLASEFNKLPWEPEKIRTIVVPPSSKQSTPAITEAVDIVDNPLVIGKRFLSSDFIINPISPLSDFASGVQVFGIGEAGAYDYADRLYEACCIKTYHLTGMFGRASSDGRVTGGTLFQTPWRHITHVKIDKVLSLLESRARSAALLHAGIVPNTQRAYEILSHPRSLNAPPRAVTDPSEWLQPTKLAPYWDRKEGKGKVLQGTPDPSSVSQMPTSLSAIRCVAFKPPFFTIEVQVQHETDEFMSDLVANIGAYLRSAACLSKTRRLRHGVFTASESLLLKYCVLPQNTAELLSRRPQLADFESDGAQAEDSGTGHLRLGDLVDTSSSCKRHRDILSNLNHCNQLFFSHFCPKAELIVSS